VIDVDAFNAFEAAGWEARAAEYNTCWPALTSRLSDALLDAVEAGPDTRILDVACGPGHLAARAAERGATAVGVDIAEPMVRIARQRFPRAEFEQGDAQRCSSRIIASTRSSATWVCRTSAGRSRR
jgi:2-polyprenyl-3-methyl-5-hydroxy-6-metoxy-1,4-benzoquinol methylase